MGCVICSTCYKLSRLTDPSVWTCTCCQYCLVKDVLDNQRLAKIRRGCEIAIRELVGRDPERSGNRGSHRYSFQDNGTPGSPNAVEHFGLQDYWSVLLDPPAVLEIMEAVFGTKEFGPAGIGGGDFNTPGMTAALKSGDV